MKLSWAVALFTLTLGFAAGCSSTSAPTPSEFDPLVSQIQQSEWRRDPRIISDLNLLAHPSPYVRRSQVRMIARVQPEGATARLLASFANENEKGVLTEVAFALGLIGDPAAATFLTNLLDSESESLRAEATAALGKLESDETSVNDAIFSVLSRSLRDESSSVRARAARALKRSRERAVPGLARVLRDDGSPEVRAAAAYSLAAIETAEATAVLSKFNEDPNPWVQTFVARGLRHQTPTRAGIARLVRITELDQNHWTARATAWQSLERLCRAQPDTEQLDPEEPGPKGPAPGFGLAAISKIVVEAARTRAPSESNELVLESLVAALGAAAAYASEARPELLNYANGDYPVRIREIALVAAVRARPESAETIEQVRAAFESSEPGLRQAAIQAAGYLGGAATPLIRSALESDRPVDRVLALEALVRLRDHYPQVPTSLRAAVQNSDFAVRASAVQGLATLKELGWIDELLMIYRNSRWEEFWETRTTILEALREEERVEELLPIALADPSLGVRRLAHAIASRRGLPTPEWLVEPGASTAISPYPPIGREELYGGENPYWILETERGRVTIELFREDAPLHVAAIVALNRVQHYDGLTIHRVVPAFVVQGGDPHGDGWGDAGFYLPDEINPRRYQRGSVGMPKAGPDTGGGQFFITHMPTPHLDDRYTIFGQVVLGMENVDALRIGDVIEKSWIDENHFRSSLERASGEVD